jgi:hypothetical protein
MSKPFKNDKLSPGRKEIVKASFWFNHSYKNINSEKVIFQIFFWFAISKTYGTVFPNFFTHGTLAGD